MSDSRELLRIRLAAKACVMLLAALIVHNGVVAWKNQSELPEHERPRVWPSGIEEVASLNRHPGIRARVANFYFLEERLGGDEILIPKSFSRYVWYFENVARMRVVLSTENLVIHPRKLRELRLLVAEHGEYNRRWYFGVVAGKRFYQRLRVLENGKVDRYVLAETANGRELFVIPRKTFNGVRARRSLEPGPHFGPQKEPPP